MKLFLKRKMRWIILAFALGGLFLSGCVTVRITDIKTDTLSNDKEFSSILYWHIHVTDHTGKMNNAIPRLYISWYDETKKKFVPCDDGDKMAAVRFMSLAKCVGWWRDDNGVPTLDTTLFKKAKPGRYRLEKIEMVTDYQMSTPTNERYKYVDIFIDKEMSITADYAHYMGTFDVNFAGENKGTYNYTFKLLWSDEDTRQYYALFQDNYPALGQQFKNNVLNLILQPISARVCNNKTVMREDFHTNSRNWITSNNNKDYSMSFNNGQYVIETKNDNFTYSTIAIPGLPADSSFFYKTDCNIELTAVWSSGVDNMPFGLLVGSGNPGYCFFVTRNGKAAIFLAESANYNRITDWSDVGQFKDGENIHLLAELTPGRGAFFVNGKYVATINTNLYMGTDKIIGLAVGGKQKAAFKHLEVKTP